MAKSESGDTKQTKRTQRKTDWNLNWVASEYPQLEEWVPLAAEWLKGEPTGFDMRLRALIAFLEKFLVRLELPLEPSVFLLRSTLVPDFFQAACPHSPAGVKYNNIVHTFLDFVLLRNFSVPADDGTPVISPGYKNQVPRRSQTGLPTPDESVHTPLPYGYIDELRGMLVEGPNFRDWKFAQSALGCDVGKAGTVGPEWFPVPESLIDKDDPDCVWRLRQRDRSKGGPVLEMWSPVRWVALLLKLQLPLRTFQVRVLDSGEGDTWKFEKGNWCRNMHPLAASLGRQLVQQGVFRRDTSAFEAESKPLLFINTNKTADIAKSSTQKGYTFPWTTEGQLPDLVFYWLEKLRNWQEKYNPISRRTAWTELDGRHLPAKSEMQLSSYPDTCFLFRTREAKEKEWHLPVTDSMMRYPWFCLLKALEDRLANRHETHANGAPIKFLPPPEQQNQGRTTLFPLHSLRVSLITALALEGQVPFPVLMKLVGHSRLLMTLYYTKPGAARVRDTLSEAAAQLESNKARSILNFLQDTEHEALVQQAICNSPETLAAAIPEHPAARNLAGWMLMHHGLCLAGGNTSEVAGMATLGGCYNGGPNIGPPTAPRYSPVPGGSRNCIRCRWFLTEPHHLPALAAHFNILAYHFDEARNACLTNDAALQTLKKEKAEAEEAERPYPRLEEYRKAERIWEKDMKRFSDRAEDLVACYRLIERCQKLLNEHSGNGNQLVAVGTSLDVQFAFEEIESELLQLVGVCQDAEVYPDLEPGKAVFRRSQLLDAALCRENKQPIFMLLSEQDQLKAGNAFMRRLALQMNPANPALGCREVIRLMDAGVGLSQHFDMDIASLLPTTNPILAVPVRRPALSGDEA